jgi:hypothetical protein
MSAAVQTSRRRQLTYSAHIPTQRCDDMKRYLMALCVFLASCAADKTSLSSEAFDSTERDLPGRPSAWAAKQIADFEAGKPVNGYKIQRVTYQGADAFLFIAPCCDRFNHLYDRAGNRICAPSGGITGQGDGKCAAPVSVWPPL